MVSVTIYLLLNHGGSFVFFLILKVPVGMPLGIELSFEGEDGWVKISCICVVISFSY